MKKIMLIAFALVCGAAYMNCDAKKPKKNQEDPEVAELKKQIELQKLKNELAAEEAKGAIIETPCSQFMDDADYFREVGIGTNANQQSARLAAIDGAKQMIHRKLAEFVQGFSTDYSNLHSGSKPADDMQRKMETKMNATVERMLNDVSKICEETRKNTHGTYDVYYAVEISKADLKKNLINDLSADEKLGIDFNEAMFEKEMDKYWNQMQADKKNAGY